MSTARDETLVPIQMKRRRNVGRLLCKNIKNGSNNTDKQRNYFPIRSHCPKYVEGFGVVCDQRPHAVLEELNVVLQRTVAQNTDVGSDTRVFVGWQQDAVDAAS